MAVNLNAVSLFPVPTSITPTAPLIEGVAATNLIAGTAPSCDMMTGAIGRFGMRATYPAPMDFTGYDFFSMQHNSNQYGPGQSMDTIANGGLRLIFIDSAGSYAGFNVYGGNIPNYDPGGGSNGFMVNNNGIYNTFHFSRTRQPDIASGVINWADIVAIESTTKTTASSRKHIQWSKPIKRNAPSVTGTETLASLVTACRAATSALLDIALVSGQPMFQHGTSQIATILRIGLTVGNGTLTTNFTESNFAIGLDNPHEFSPAFRSTGPWTQMGADHVRALKLIQSPTDVLSLTDGSIASAGWWQWELSGSGVATCTRVQFWRFDGFRAAHGTYTDCVWNNATAPVEVTAATVITGGLIRGATTTALKILGAAGVYSGLSLKIDSDAATYDVELGSGGAGTYELLKITVPDGYTLRLRNNSATNAVVVKLPLGLAYSTSTAGGAISVQIPVVSVAVEAPALIAGSRVQLYNQTDGVELLNIELASVGLALSLPYTGNKIVRLRADHNSKLPLETAGVLTASGLTFLDVQAEDDVYIGNAIDGSLVTEFTPDNANIQVDINDPDGITAVQRLYAWMQWYMTTEAGVRSDFFGAMFAIDSANYQIDQAKANINLDNVSLMPVRVVGGNLTRRDGSTVIAATSGSIQMDPGKAYAIEIGTSGLTTEEATLLSLLARETTAQAIKADTLNLLTVTAPSAATISTSVWSHNTAALLAREATLAAVGTDIDNILAKPDITVPTADQIRDSVWADAVVTTLAKEDTLVALDDKVDGLVAKPEPTIPTAALISASVWAASEAAALAKETTLLLVDTKLTDHVAKPDLVVPTTVEIKTAVWADAKADLLAKEATLLTVAMEVQEVEGKVDVLVDRPLGSGPTALQVAEAVWAHTFAKSLLTVGKFLGLK